MPAIIDNISHNNMISNEKFSVERLLETQKGCERRIRDEVIGEEVIERLDSNVKPKLKFGVDSILEGGLHINNNKTNNCETNPYMERLMSLSRGTQSEYYGSYCDNQCIIAFNKPIANPYIHWNNYTNTAIPANSFGEGFYGYQSHCSLNSHYNQPSVRTGVQSGSQSKKKTAGRAVFSSLQRQKLEERFKKQKYITKPERLKVALSLRLSDSQVKVWFQNRRMKWRHSRDYKEEVEKTQTNREQLLITSFPTNKSNGNDDNSSGT